MAHQKLKEQIRRLAGKPGHETVRHILSTILKERLGAKDDEITFEEKLACRGRIDALWGRTVFEIKRDLSKELSGAESQIKRYIRSKEGESRTAEKYVGIASDGKKYIAYFLHNESLKKTNELVLSEDKASEFIQWLESVVLIKKQLEPTPEIICKQIGQGSPLCCNALLRIKSLWTQAKLRPDIRLKYDLWKKSVDIVYGTEGADDSLFLEHTYLTIISKAIAHAAFFPDAGPPTGKHLLNGKLFKEVNISGVIEDDFFSWPVFCGAGNDLIRQIASHVRRFDFSAVQADILKGLYEGLIRQEQRHKMGEYYTPDWLAEKICKEVIKKPLENRVIDPACGSGTFLFHSIRLLIASAEKKNLSAKETIGVICDKIAGIDIHPVAVIFSRITYLLAILKTLQKGRPDNMSVPVYLGDSLQWSIDEVLGGKSLRITVPEDRKTGAQKRQLVFPESVCLDRKLFKKALDKMIELAGKLEEAEIFQSWIKKHLTGEKPLIETAESQILSRTYKTLLKLQKEERNHIWGHVASNLTRPIWLSSEKHKADIVIGNPPWLRFNSMNTEMQKKLKTECFSLNLWEKKTEAKFRTSQDISTYFFIRSVDLYMKEKGKAAFVMPFGVMNGDGHSSFRKGIFEREGQSIHIKFKSGWIFDSKVKNLFKVPSCVLFSVRKDNPEQNKPPLPKILRFEGDLPQKNAGLKEALKVLSQKQEAWPALNQNSEPSFYFDKFKQGACLVPRRFIFVEKIQKGQLGSSAKTPFVRGRASDQDKVPWKEIDPPEGKIESQFLKPVWTGRSITPFRVISKNTAVIPHDNKGIMDAAEAAEAGWTDLSAYLEKAEKLWDQNSKGKMTFKEQINFRNKLTKQFSAPTLKVVYGASGTYPAAALLENKEGIIDSSLYYTEVKTKEEGLYLEGILNSSSLIERIRGLQAQGQWGARHISRHLLKPYFPQYNPQDRLHKDIADCAREIKKIVCNTEIEPNCYFITARRKIRQRIEKEEGAFLWKRLNQLVSALLEKGNEKRPRVS